MHEGQQFGHYTLIKRVACGGMAEIHLAKTSGIAGFEKLLALKVINPKFSTDQEFIDMLIDEAKISVQLSHVNIGQTFDLGRVDDTYFIALEFIDGRDLYQILVRCAELDRHIPQDILTFIGMESAAGLHYAHTRCDPYGRALDLIHRDISPQNILVSFDGEVKIVDFGIAKASQRSRETESGIIKGKFFYMSPEQAWGDTIDARTDIFSTGICLYEMVTGEMLYQEDKALVLLNKVRKAQIPSMKARRPDLSDQLQSIVLKALSKSREGRFQTSHELQVALQAFLFRNWPGFNRRRVAEFITEIFGDQRLVLPMPEPPQPVPSVTADIEEISDPTGEAPLMDARDFEQRAGESLIFDLSNLDVSFPAGSVGSTHDEDFDDDNDPTVAGIMVPPDVGGPEEEEEEDEERTIAGNYWSRTRQPNSESPTDALGPMEFNRTSPIGRGGDSSSNRVGADQAGPASDLPTQLFDQEPEGGDTEERPSLANVARPVPSPARPVTPPPRLPATPISSPPVRSGPPATPPHASPPPPASNPQPAVVASGGVANLPTRPQTPPVEPPVEPPVDKLRNRADEHQRPTISATPDLRVSMGFGKGKAKKGKGRGKAGTNKGFFGKLVGWMASAKGVTVVVLLGLSIYLGMHLFPTVVPAPEIKKAILVIDSTPHGARVILDGQDTQMDTPARFTDLPIDTLHTLRLTLKGYQPYSDTVAIGADTLPKTGELRKRYFLEKARGKLKVVSMPPGAEVYIDGKFAGETPLQRVDVDRTKNEMMVLVRKDDFRERREVIRWDDEIELKLELELTKRKR